MKAPKPQAFNPPIQPIISAGEIDAYTAMIDGRLVPGNKSSLFSTSAVVVGAGLAGLAAARELKKAGVNVTILEGSDRAGGRCHTLSSSKFDKGLFAEAGGMRVPESHKIAMKYINTFGLKTIPFSNMKDKSGLLFFDGKKKKIDEDLNNPKSVLSRVVEKWDESIRPIRLAFYNKSITWDELMEKYCSKSVVEFLHDEKWPQELIQGFRKYGVGLGAYDTILELSFLEILRLFIIHDYDSKNFQLEGGNESLVDSFLFDNQIPLSSYIQYGYKVSSIVKNSDGRYLITSATSSSTYECDYVIVTIPLPQLRTISFDPPLRDELRDAIDNVHYVKAAKIFLQTKSRFWLQHGVDGMMISDLTIQNTYFSPAFSSSSKGMITASYVWEHQAEKFFALSEEQKIALAVDELKQAFPEIEQEFERGAAVDFEQGFCIFRPGQATLYHNILREEVAAGVFLAGEHCSVEHGYFEGALESGLRAAANIFRCIDEDFFEQFDRMLSCSNDKAVGYPTSEEYTSLLATTPSFWPMNITGKPKLPIFPKRLDHYTLICSDAKQVADFHTKYLQFELDSIKPVNTGTVAEGDYDMLNYILRPPANKGMLMVVTEGLNDETIFRKYMKAHGHGIHHFAFEVDDVDIVFAAIKEMGIQTTSEKVTKDIISGLKQFFIAPCHAGFFIEMIERPRCNSEVDKRKQSDTVDQEELFTTNNMAELAQSISEFVNPKLSQCSPQEEKKNDEHTREDIVADMMAGVDVGTIAAIEVAVDNLASSVSFLVEVLNFRFIRHDDDMVLIGLPGANESATIILKQARSTNEERKAAVVFNAPNLNPQKFEEASRANLVDISRSGVIGSITLPDEHTTYKVILASPSETVPFNQVVRSYPSFFDLNVDVRAKLGDLMNFLSDPGNLPIWTGHRSIRYCTKMNSWVESRSNGSDGLTDFILEVKVKEGSTVYFCWPDRKVEVVFHCSEVAPGYSSISVRLPSTLSERTLARMKQIVSIELDLLKSIIERNTKDVIPDHFYQQIDAYHMDICGIEKKRLLPDDAPKEFGFRGNVLTGGNLFEQMSTDFALTITSTPQMVLVPIDVADVQAAVKMANAYNIPLAARGSRVSHSAGGQAQADGGIVLDMSPLSSVEFDASQDAVVVKAGAGTYWDEVIRQTLRHGLMPPVVNDYQYLSVGGTVSMGGVGFMSHQYGIQAAHVNKLEMVTGLGDYVVCSKENQSDLFDCARGGLGQCGIITSVTIPLVKAPTNIRTYKLFYPASNSNLFLKDVKSFVNSGKFDMIHAFLKPCTRTTIMSILGPNAFDASSTKFKELVQDGESNKSLVYFLELGCYLWDDLSSSIPGNCEDIPNLFVSKENSFLNGEYFTNQADFSEYIRKDPPVVETNKEHGKIPHPSFATLIDEDHAPMLLDHHLASNARGDDRTNEILIMPVKSNSNLSSGHNVPMFALPKDSELSFFLLFLGSVVPKPQSDKSAAPSCSDQMSTIRAHHRKLYSLSTKLGGKRYSYDTITAEVKGETEWKAHFGCQETWNKLVLQKRKFDPKHILCPGVDMFSDDRSSSGTAPETKEEWQTTIG